MADRGAIKAPYPLLYCVSFYGTRTTTCLHTCTLHSFMVFPFSISLSVSYYVLYVHGFTMYFSSETFFSLICFEQKKSFLINKWTGDSQNYFHTLRNRRIIQNGYLYGDGGMCVCTFMIIIIQVWSFRDVYINTYIHIRIM